MADYLLILGQTNRYTVMDEDIRAKAEKKIEARMTFYTAALVFAAVAIVLVILSFAIPSIAFWVLIPLPVLLMVLGVVYLNAFGYPGTNPDAEDWREEEIEKEVRKLERRRASGRPTDAEHIDTGGLELKELERMERPSEDDLV